MDLVCIDFIRENDTKFTEIKKEIQKQKGDAKTGKKFDSVQG